MPPKKNKKNKKKSNNSKPAEAKVVVEDVPTSSSAPSRTMPKVTPSAAADSNMSFEDRRKRALVMKGLGNSQFSAKKFEEAIKSFSQALEWDSSDRVFWSNRSACYAAVGQWHYAVTDAQQCVKADPKWAKGYSRLGLSLMNTGDLKGALEAYHSGLVIDPRNKSIVDGMKAVKVLQETKPEPSSSYNNNNNDDSEEVKGDGNAADGTEYVIGIDLGTTFSCVAVWKDGQVEVLPNEEGKLTTPSWVAFTDEGRLVGEPAKKQAASNPERTLFNIKRIIGRDYVECSEDLRHMPFKVEKDNNGKPSICVDVNGKGKIKQYLPEQISAMVLEKMKISAEAYLGCKVNKAVITVPAYFNDAQRRLTKDAGAIAGLEVLRIINEPTAAALAYGLDKTGDSERRHVLVFDLGGGTFDVSLLKIEEGMFNVLATAGDTHLGGEDFDTVLADWVAAQHAKKTGKFVFSDSPGNLRKLRNACEQVKRQLSASQTAQLECWIDGEEVGMEITRTKFEALNNKTFERCLNSVKRVLVDAKVAKEDVDDIVLVGGSTRVPKVRSILSEFFGGRTLCSSVHPDEAVAYGAAVQGAILAGVRDEQTQMVLLVDVVPLSLGVECEGKHFAKVVQRNTSVPCRKTSEFTTVHDYQTEIDVRVFEGEHVNTDGNHLLGEFTISGVQRAKKGEAKIDVCFEVNTNGLLAVSARDQVTGSCANVAIHHNRGRLSQDEVARMCAEAEELRAVETQREAQMEALERKKAEDELRSMGMK